MPPVRWIASPRTCFNPFADQVALLTKSGGGKYIFRIVNDNDPVPTVPPESADQLSEYPFIHVAGAWKISSTAPVKMADEPPPVEPSLQLQDMQYHRKRYSVLFSPRWSADHLHRDIGVLC